MMSMIEMREALAMVETRLKADEGEDFDEKEEEAVKKRKQVLVAREIETLDLKSLTLSELEAQLAGRIEEAKAGSVECVVKWEMEREICWARGGSTEGSEVATAIVDLESRLVSMESWLNSQRAQVESLRESAQRSTAVQSEAEVKRSNLAKLEQLVAKIVAPVPVGLSLSPKTEEHLVRPDEYIYQAIATGTKAEQAIQNTARLVQTLRAARDHGAQLLRDPNYRQNNAPLRALKDRMGQLHALSDAFAAGVERYGRSFFGEEASRHQRHAPSLASLLGYSHGFGSFRKENDLKYRAMSAAALRTAMSHTQREIHACAEAECGALFQAVASLDRPDTLRRLRATFAAATADLYALQMRAYFDALEEDQTGLFVNDDNGKSSPSHSPTKRRHHRRPSNNSVTSVPSTHTAAGLTHRFLEELSPIVIAEKRACDTLFRHTEKQTAGDPCLSVQLAEMRSGALRLTQSHSQGILAAVALLESNPSSHSSKQDIPFLQEVRCALADTAERQWEQFLDERAKWIRSAETSRKRDHGSGASSAAIELAGLAQKLENALAGYMTHGGDSSSYYRVAGPFYAKLGDAFFDWRRKAINADNKYGILIKLENTFYLVQRLEKDGQTGPAAKLSAALRGELNDATRAYSHWMWTYEFQKLDTYFTRLGGGISSDQAYSPSHRPAGLLSPSRLRLGAPTDTNTPPNKMLPSLQGLDDGLGKILKRLDKHFPTGSRSDPRLSLILRRAVLDHARSVWARYDDLARTHFSQAIQPTRNQLDAICANYNRASAGGAYATGEYSFMDDEDDFDRNSTMNNDGGRPSLNTARPSILPSFPRF